VSVVGKQVDQWVLLLLHKNILFVKVNVCT